jgi:hypothetical protein
MRYGSIQRRILRESQRAACASGKNEDGLGNKQPYMLTSVSNLGLVPLRQGKFEEAEAMHQQALEWYEKTHTCSLKHAVPAVP